MKSYYSLVSVVLYIVTFYVSIARGDFSLSQNGYSKAKSAEIRMDYAKGLTWPHKPNADYWPSSQIGCAYKKGTEFWNINADKVQDQSLVLNDFSFCLLGVEKIINVVMKETLEHLYFYPEHIIIANVKDKYSIRPDEAFSTLPSREIFIDYRLSIEDMRNILRSENQIHYLFPDSITEKESE
jgi:hypothetical protein